MARFPEIVEFEIVLNSGVYAYPCAPAGILARSPGAPDVLLRALQSAGH